MFLISYLTCAPHTVLHGKSGSKFPAENFTNLLRHSSIIELENILVKYRKSSTEKGLIYFIFQHFTKLDILMLFITHNIAKTEVFFCTSCLYCHGGFVVKTHARPSPIFFTIKIGVWPLMVFAIIIKIILLIWGIIFISKVIIKTYQNWLFITN